MTEIKPKPYNELLVRPLDSGFFVSTIVYNKSAEQPVQKQKCYSTWEEVEAAVKEFKEAN